MELHTGGADRNEPLVSLEEILHEDGHPPIFSAARRGSPRSVRTNAEHGGLGGKIRPIDHPRDAEVGGHIDRGVARDIEGDIVTLSFRI